MANTQPRRADLVTAEQFEAILTQLDEIAGRMRAALLVAKQSPQNGLATYNFPSAIAGLARVKSFSDAVGDSMLK